jgi:hypothetical protein
MTEWLTLSATASRLRWDLHKVESRARREGWPKRRGNRGRAMEYLVPAGLLTPSSAERDGATDSVVTARDGVNLATDGVIVEALAELRHALGRAEGELAAEQRRGAELVATLTTALDRERARADRLEAEALALARALAEARRPWLAKVLEGLRRKI